MADIFVTTLTDITDANDGETTLREAIAAAAAGDRILFQSGISGTLALT